MLYKTQILQMYVEEKMSIKKIAQVIKKSRPNISKLLTEAGVLKSISDWRTKYIFNHNYFSDINTENKAYFLGLIFADGNISMNHSSHTIRLTSKDKSILLAFLQDLKSDSIVYREYHKKYKKECFKIRLTSTKMYHDLNNLGCVPVKSLILKFPKNLSQDLIPHFIRGYFDGDGTVGIYTNKTSTWKRLVSGFAGTENFLNGIQENLPITNKTLKKSKNLYLLNFSVQDSITLYNYMYSNAVIFLKRKHDIFYDFIKQRGSTTTIDNPPHKWRVKV